MHDLDEADETEEKEDAEDDGEGEEDEFDACDWLILVDGPTLFFWCCSLVHVRCFF